MKDFKAEKVQLVQSLKIAANGEEKQRGLGIQRRIYQLGIVLEKAELFATGSKFQSYQQLAKNVGI